MFQVLVPMARVACLRDLKLDATLIQLQNEFHSSPRISETQKREVCNFKVSRNNFWSLKDFKSEVGGGKQATPIPSFELCASGAGV